MSRNAHQIVRQWRILRALEASRRGLTVQEIREAIDADCDQRTIYRDVEALEAAGFPLHKDEEERRWRVLEPREGGWVVPLSPTELIALALSESLFSNLHASQLLEPLSALRSKLLAMMGPKGRQYFEEVRQSSIATLKAPSEYAHKGEILESLQDAVQEHEVIVIRHHKPGDPAPRDRTIEPYALWFTDGGFYLIAFCREANDYRHFAIQRIASVVRVGASFEPSSEFDPAAYTRKGFGAFHGPVQRVRLRFSPSVAFLARERRFHHTQRAADNDDGGIDLTMELAGLPELASWVAGFGGDVVPLHPPQLRELVRSRFERGLARLDGNDDGLSANVKTADDDA